MKLSVIYVNYNTEKLMLASLLSLRENFKAETDYEVIVVDNASDGFSATLVKKIFPKSKIIKNDKNLGFGQANNLATKQATGDYLWLLNTDTIIPPDNKLEKVIDFLDANSSYGVASPQLILGNGQPQATQVGRFPSIWRQILQKFFPDTALGMHYLPVAPADVPCVAAAAVFIRRQAFNEVGGFTPDYFMYFEDTDLWQKLKRAGHKIRFLPTSKVTHLESQSIKDPSELKKVYFASQDIYYQRWKSSWSQFLLKISRQVIKGKRKWVEQKQ